MDSNEVANRAGISYRQLDHWSRKGYVGGGSPGSGRERSWSPKDARKVYTIAELIRSGFKLEKAAEVVNETEDVQVLKGEYITVTIARKT